MTALGNATALRDAVYEALREDNAHDYIWGYKPDLTGQSENRELRIYKELYPGQRTVALREWVGLQYRASWDDLGCGPSVIIVQFNFYAEKNIDPVKYEDQAHKILEISGNAGAGLGAKPTGGQLSPAVTRLTNKEFMLLEQRFKLAGGY